MPTGATKGRTIIDRKPPAYDPLNINNQFAAAEEAAGHPFTTEEELAWTTQFNVPKPPTPATALTDPTTQPPADAVPEQAPHPLLSPGAMTRLLSPQTMVSMKSPLINGLWGMPLWKKGINR